MLHPVTDFMTLIKVKDWVSAQIALYLSGFFLILDNM